MSTGRDYFDDVTLSPSIDAIESDPDLSPASVHLRAPTQHMAKQTSLPHSFPHSQQRAVPSSPLRPSFIAEQLLHGDALKLTDIPSVTESEESEGSSTTYV